MPKPYIIEATDELEGMIQGCEDLENYDIDIQAAEGEDKPATFSMSAYTGGKMRVPFFPLPVIVDLAGMSVTKKPRPILREHNSNRIVGHSTEIEIKPGSLAVSGILSASNRESAEVINSSKKGFPWQASIGARPEEMIRVDRGESVTVNGRTFKGPVLVARKSVLKEISFVALGADDKTTARVAAKFTTNKEVSNTVEFEEWLTAKFGDGEFTESQKEILRASYEAEVNGAGGSENTGHSNTDTLTSDAITNFRASMATEATRQADLQTVCASHPAILAEAIKENWTPDKAKDRVELAGLYASLPKPGERQEHSGLDNVSAIEASLCMTTGLSEKDTGKFFDEKTMNAALDMTDVPSLRTLMVQVIQATGGHAGIGRITDTMIRAALYADQQIRASGTSTISMSGILGNVANKHMMKAYNKVESVYHEFCDIDSVSDFKETSYYSMTGPGTFKKIGKNGELKHGTLGEESYKQSVDTEGLIIALTRQDMINDSLSAFTRIVKGLGRSAAMTVEEAVFTVLLASTMHSAGNKNLLTGATSVLDIDGVSLAEEKFIKQIGPDKKPILVSPKILLVPPALKTTAEDIYTEKKILLDTAKAKTANNSHVGKYRSVYSPYMDNDIIPGGSDKKWYLFADPADIASFVVSFLNGKSAPTIQSSEADFSTLGMQWRAFLDFGVDEADHRGSLRSDGE